MTNGVMPDWITPEWPVAPRVNALITTCNGGVSTGDFAGAYDAGGLNLGDNTNDDPECVRQNKIILRRFLPAEPTWLNQIHGNGVLRLPTSMQEHTADAVFTTETNVVCQVRTADCLPVLLADQHGSVVGVAHAGWRGLAAGVIEATVVAMRQASPHAQLCAYLGPAIGPRAFEVGDEVREIFLAHDVSAQTGFQPKSLGKWWADLYFLARLRLQNMGITLISGGNYCTYTEHQRFYSYRRQAMTGRMASCIWLAELK